MNTAAHFNAPELAEALSRSQQKAIFAKRGQMAKGVRPSGGGKASVKLPSVSDIYKTGKTESSKFQREANFSGVVEKTIKKFPKAERNRIEDKMWKAFEKADSRLRSEYARDMGR